MTEPFQRFCDVFKKGFVDASGPLTFWSERGEFERQQDFEFESNFVNEYTLEDSHGT